QTRRPFGSAQDPVTVANSGGGITVPPDNGIFTFMYDGYGRATRVDENAEQILERMYFPLTIETRDREQLPGGGHVGAYTRVEMNGRGQVKRTMAHTNSLFGDLTTDVTFDGLGQALQVTRLYGPTAVYTRAMTYDTMGRLVANDEPNTSRNGKH